ncbi:hypothetical protein FB45DRAFT_998939 [Roridomyces roridus]|uniref:F-box domain-containing protein n=1 Tax=Roridomyces roridus TaxID=1738132 RepID=A0AAD7CIV0_9AGAR|nr:hypothetical protein FB45DRAFT_998939 [Roridomyces roridus]
MSKKKISDRRGSLNPSTSENAKERTVSGRILVEIGWSESRGPDHESLRHCIRMQMRDESSSRPSSTTLPMPGDMTIVLEHLRARTWQDSEEPRLLHVCRHGPQQLAQYDMEMERLRKQRQQLEEYVDACRVLFSPVRRLPHELLEKIFDMCAPPSAHDISDMDTTSQELDRLAKRHLLYLSQVCRTLRLWSKVIMYPSLWFGGLAPESTFLNLLGHLLERSGTCPLTIEVSVVDLFPAVNRALQMLIEHAGRWKNVCGPLETFRNLGELSLLEVLMLADDEHDESDVVVFETEPQLKNFQFLGKLAGSLQISRDVTHLFDSMNLIPRFTNRTKSLLYLDVDGIDATVILPPIVSDLSYLYLTLSAPVLPLRCPFGLGILFPRLRIAHCWLTELKIEMRITDEELIQCLGTLPLLKVLLVSDLTKACSENVVVTDKLLRRLTFQTEAESQNLVPALHFWYGSTLFRFADDVYWGFLVSRLESGKKPEEPLQARLFRLDSEERRLSFEIRSRIHALVSQRLLGFVMLAA